MESTVNVGLDVLREAIAKREVTPIAVEGVPHLIVPDGFKVESYEKLLDEPRRIARRVVAHDVRGLIAYVNEFKDDRTALFCGAATAPKIEAKIDDHRPNEPSHITHTTVYDCPRTAEWQTWTAKNRQAMSQIEFAEFLEANIRDIAEPSGTDILAKVLQFEDTAKAEFKSALRMESGRVQFTYIEKEENRIEFPTIIKLGLPVFEGVAQRYAVDARLRYRIKDQSLVLWFELDRPDIVLRAAYDELLAHVEEQTGISIYRAAA